MGCLALRRGGFHQHLPLLETCKERKHIWWEQLSAAVTLMFGYTYVRLIDHEVHCISHSLKIFVMFVHIYFLQNDIQCRTMILRGNYKSNTCLINHSHVIDYVDFSCLFVLISFCSTSSEPASAAYYPGC